MSGIQTIYIGASTFDGDSGECATGMQIKLQVLCSKIGRRT